MSRATDRIAQVGVERDAQLGNLHSSRIQRYECRLTTAAPSSPRFFRGTDCSRSPEILQEIGSQNRLSAIFPNAVLYIDPTDRYRSLCRSGSRGGRETLEESPDIKGQGGRGIDPGKPAGKCNRKQTADGAVPRERPTGKVETVR